jgi:competence protein ComEA
VGQAAGAPWRVIDESADSPPSTERSGARRLLVAGALVAAVGLGVAAFALAATSGGSGGIAVAGAPALPAPSGEAMPRTSAVVVVEVVGAVRQPGVLRLPVGSRIGDAIEAAGGYSARLDAGRAARELNLAAKLEDGARVSVPSRDDPVATEQPGAAAASGGGGVIHLSRATAAELDALPGIGPVTAAKILASRDEKAFASVDDLRTRKLVGASTFEKLRALVAVP